MIKKDSYKLLCCDFINKKYANFFFYTMKNHFTVYVDNYGGDDDVIEGH